jgi:transposase
MKRYEVTDAQWQKIKDLLPPEQSPGGGRRAKDNRKMFNAMLWVARSGAPWRDLPEYYGSWKSVYTRFRRWQMGGVFDEALDALSQEADEESVMIDATIVRVHQHGCGAKGGSKIRISGKVVED